MFIDIFIAIFFKFTNFIRAPIAIVSVETKWHSRRGHRDDGEVAFDFRRERGGIRPTH